MSVTVVDVHAEYRKDTSWVGVPAPRLSWKAVTEKPGWLQASAEVEVTRSGRTEVAEVRGRDSVLVQWPFAPLAAREHVTVRVRVTGIDEEVSEWSDPRELRAALLRDGEWAAQMVGISESDRAHPGLVRRDIHVDGEVKTATLYATAHGAYQVWINGMEADDEILKPGWTSYQWRLIHETTNVTSLLRAGENAIGIDFAGAWYTENYGFDGNARTVYGDQPAVAAQLVIEYVDGRQETIVTDATWRASAEGPRRISGIYRGEVYDAGREQQDWASPGFDDSGWSPARVESAAYPVPRPRTSPAVRATQELGVQEVVVTPSGRTIVDFGQNLVGRVRIRVQGQRGATVTLRHAEVLEDGELGTRPLRYAEATNSYTLAGVGAEVWEPRFTFQGFRYVEIDGWPGEFDPADITAVVIHSEMERIGDFESSHPLLNRLHENVVWGMRGNFLSVPTDCPQRDERLGWTGDLQVFSPTASFLYDTRGFLGSWLEDLWLEQQNGNGIVPWVVPSVLDHHATAAWGDAATVVPSVMYERYGDLDMLRAQFPSMRAWSETLEGLAGPSLLWDNGFQFGDWLDPAAPAEEPFGARMDSDLVATAYFFRSVDLTARAAQHLGLETEAIRFADLADRIKSAFLSNYATPGGRLMSDAQSAYAVAIMFGISADEEQRARFAARLADLVRANGYRIGTGFVGTPLIEDALSTTGHLRTGARLLLTTENPSWLYPVTMGATTIWERWDSMLEDGTINPGEMTSFNHYAFGAVADWLHRQLCGLAPGEPGYRVIHVEPHPIDGLDFARAELETPYGRATAGWSRTGASIEISVTVPPNTTARVQLPDGARHEVGSGMHVWTVAAAQPAPSKPLDMGSSLADLIEDRETFEAVIAAIRSIDDPYGERFRRRERWTGKSIDAALVAASVPVRDAVRRVLAAHSEELGKG